MSDLLKEKELLDLVKSNKENYEYLYKYFVNDVYRFSYSLVNNREDAEDITSKVFLEFYKKVDNYEWRGISLKSWLFQTARNFCYKVSKVSGIIEEFNEDYRGNEELEVSFVDEIMNLELVEKIKEEIHKLSLPEKEVINLRIWEGMTFVQIAEIQNSPEAACKKRFYRAIIKIKNSLESKNIRFIITLPFLFTGIKQVSSTPAYAAPINLFNSYSAFKPNFPPASNAKSLFLTIGTLTAVAIVGLSSGFIYFKNRENKEADKTANNLTLTPTLNISDTIIPSITPIISPSASAIVPTPTIVPVSNTNKEYAEWFFLGAEKRFGIDFEIPKGSTATLTDRNTSPESYLPMLKYYTIEDLEKSVFKLDIRVAESSMQYKFPEYEIIGNNKDGKEIYRMGGFNEGTYGYGSGVVEGKCYDQSSPKVEETSGCRYRTVDEIFFTCTPYTSEAIKICDEIVLSTKYVYPDGEF